MKFLFSWNRFSLSRILFSKWRRSTTRENTIREMVLEEENYSRERGFVASFSPDDARDTRVVLFRWRVPPRVISVATSRPLSRLIAGTWFEFTAEFTKRPGRSFVRHGASYNAIPFRIRNSTKGRKYWNKIKTACVEISTSRIKNKISIFRFLFNRTMFNLFF